MVSPGFYTCAQIEVPLQLKMKLRDILKEVSYSL